MPRLRLSVALFHLLLEDFHDHVVDVFFVGVFQTLANRRLAQFRYQIFGQNYLSPIKLLTAGSFLQGRGGLGFALIGGPGGSGKVFHSPGVLAFRQTADNRQAL